MKTHVELLSKETICDGTMAFHLSRPEGFEFRAGQFVELALADSGGGDNSRAFSLVHAPCEDELVVATRMRDSGFKNTLKDLSTGSELEVDGPFGGFTLHKTETTPAVFIIGGIGVTPIRSMVVQATHDQTAHEMTLLHAARTPADLPFKADFERLAKQNPNFEYVAVATDSAPGDWQGEDRIIDAEMVQKYVPDLSRPIYYLSGPGGMVKAMRELLIDLNANEDNIRTEEFPGY